MPTTRAAYVAPVDMTFTVILVTPSTTWWLVTTSPSVVRTMPVPAAAVPSYFMVVAIRTNPVSWEPDAYAVASVDWVPCCAEYLLCGKVVSPYGSTKYPPPGPSSKAGCTRVDADPEAVLLDG